MAEEFEDVHRSETFKSLVPISIEAMKMAVLVNGGAGIALLAFLRNALGKCDKPVAVPSLGLSLRLFGIGIALGAFTFAFSYLCQNALYNESIGRGNRFPINHILWLRLGIIFALLSFGLFAYGCWDAASKFSY